MIDKVLSLSFDSIEKMLTESELNQLKKHLQSLNIDLPQGLEVEEAGIAIMRFCLSKALRKHELLINKGEKDGRQE